MKQMVYFEDSAVFTISLLNDSLYCVDTLTATGCCINLFKMPYKLN